MSHPARLGRRTDLLRLLSDGRHLDTSNLERFLPFLKSETRKDLVYLFEEFLNIIVAFFRGQLIIAFLQGCSLPSASPSWVSSTGSSSD